MMYEQAFNANVQEQGPESPLETVLDLRGNRIAD